MAESYPQLFSDGTDERRWQCRLAPIARQDDNLQTVLAACPRSISDRIERCAIAMTTYKLSCEWHYSPEFRERFERMIEEEKQIVEQARKARGWGRTSQAI